MELTTQELKLVRTALRHETNKLVSALKDPAILVLMSHDEKLSTIDKLKSVNDLRDKIIDELDKVYQ